MTTESKRRKNILQYSFLIFLMIFTTYLVMNTLDISMIPTIIEIIDYRYLLLGVLLILGYIVLEGYIIKIIINSINKSKSGLLGFKVATIGLYYNLVTPLASGSQPMQIYTLSKSKVSVSKAIAIVVNKTVVFQTIVTLYCGFLIFVNINSLRNELNPVLILVSTGVTMNIIMLCIGFLIVYSPNKTKKIMKVTISLLKKIKMFKFVEKKEVELEKFIDEYNYSINTFIKDKRALIKSMALTVIQLSMYFSIAFCIYKALRLTGDSYWHILTLQVFLYMAVSPIPTPGNVGANEIAFFTIFKGVFPELVIGYAVFLYGILIYYLMLIVCGILTIIAHYTMDKKKKIYSKI